MGEINIPLHEQIALKEVNSKLLDTLIDKCLDDESPTALRGLRLERCGQFVASRHRQYEKALAERSSAKTEKKRTETEYYARRAGRYLADAVRQMQHRVETEEKEGQFFYVEDQIARPYRFSERMTALVSYRWRRQIKDQWVFGSITFSHVADSQPDYTVAQPARKPSAAKREQDRQDKLCREWEHLARLGLHSVREYFRAGGDGAAIPQTFQAKTDRITGGLNNFSAQFWLAQP